MTEDKLGLGVKPNFAVERHFWVANAQQAETFGGGSIFYFMSPLVYPDFGEVFGRSLSLAYLHQQTHQQPHHTV